ncbi:hypothetical protein Tco_0488432 [Tanacetum coccineum]
MNETKRTLVALTTHQRTLVVVVVKRWMRMMTVAVGWWWVARGDEWYSGSVNPGSSSGMDWRSTFMHGWDNPTKSRMSRVNHQAYVTYWCRPMGAYSECIEDLGKLLPLWHQWLLAGFPTPLPIWRHLDSLEHQWEP